MIRYHDGLLGLLVLVWSTGCEAAPASGPSEPSPAVATPAVATPAPAAAPSEPGPCAHPEPLQLTIGAGETATTPYGLEIDYLPGLGKIKGLRSFEFTLRHGGRRWRVERTMANWNSRMTWRGFCWKGGTPRPKPEAKAVLIHVAPVCDAQGKLLELGGCRDVLK